MVEVNGIVLGFDEVVDTLDDALGCTEQIHEAVKDGIGLSDIGTLISVTPRLNEIRQDAATFAAQVQDLTPDESAEVARQLVARRGGSADNIVQKALAAVTLATRWHNAIDTVVDLVQDSAEFGRGFFKQAA